MVTNCCDTIYVSITFIEKYCETPIIPLTQHVVFLLSPSIRFSV
jgi:hypothetical protein